MFPKTAFRTRKHRSQKEKGGNTAAPLVSYIGLEKSCVGMGDCFERIYTVVRQIPKGTVATYGQIAALAGNPRWARVVGYALHVNPDPEHIPCHRVVNREGRTAPAFAFGGADLQRAMLEAEGVLFTPDGRVPLEHFQWGRP